jgi:imidazole glycerol-phosphate synthase subunit HisH
MSAVTHGDGRVLTIIDSGRGNLYSIAQALRRLDVPHVFGNTPAEVERASSILLPGVGAFGDAMQTLRARGLVEPLREVARDGRPFLGVCLGMQLLATSGTEFGIHEGLDLLAGTVDRLPEHEGRVPNVGWRAITVHGTERWVYFVHSYAVRPQDASIVVASAAFGHTTFPAIVRAGNVTGLQFHPEKSGRDGLTILADVLGVATSDQPLDSP